jgi:hypothetical protein
MNSVVQISIEEMRLRERLMHDFEAYAFCCLKIKDKLSGKFVPFRLNKAQKYFLDEARRQKLATGKIRAIMLKARQVGCSTFTEAKAFHFVSHREGVNAFILTHLRQSTDALFKMSKNYYDLCPKEFQPHLGKSNANELYFDNLKSGYLVGTAGEKAQGRGTTNHFFHGSEVAYWQNGGDHISGILKSIPNANNTEVYLESTANGTDNIFYEIWQKASKNQSEFIPLFAPWFWQSEYTIDRPIQGSEILDEEERDYLKRYGLTNKQMYWRRNEISLFNSLNKDGYKEFDREFPGEASVAFNVSKANGFIQPKLINDAIYCREAPCVGNKVMGVDIAAAGTDFNALVVRQGRICGGLKLWQSDDTMVTVGIIAKEIQTEKPYKVFIDSIGVGKGVYDRLREMFGDLIVSVCAAEKAIYSDRYSNKRAEMWANGKEWLEDVPCILPNDEALKIALAAQEYEQDSKQRLKMRDKEHVRKQLGHSPDAADAFMLTFAFPTLITSHKPLKYPKRSYV